MNETLVPVGGRPAWLGSTLDYREDGLWQLSAAELAEIDAALTTLKGHGDLDLIAITPRPSRCRPSGGSCHGCGTSCGRGAASC